SLLAVGVRTEPAMSANLLHYCSRVQQLLVTLLFLPGISESSKSVRHIAFRRGNRPADAGRPVSEKMSQVYTDSLIFLSDKHLDTSSRGNDFAFPDRARASPRRPTQSLTFASFTGTFTNRSPF